MRTGPDFLTSGKAVIWNIETKLGGMENSETEEVKPSPSIHLPFETFEPIDLA